MKYKQCLLTKFTFSGLINQMTWLPEKFAIQGEYIKLKTEDNGWDDGWCVKIVYKGIKFDENFVSARSQDYKKQRKTSDI